MGLKLIMNLLFPPAFSCWNVKVYIRGVHRSLSIDEKSWESSLKQRGLPASPRQRSAKEMVKIGELRKLLQGTRHHHQQGKSCQPWGPVRRAERTPFGPLTFTVSTPSLAMAWEGLGVTEGDLSLQATSVTADAPQRPMSEEPENRSHLKGRKE